MCDRVTKKLKLSQHKGNVVEIVKHVTSSSFKLKRNLPNLPSNSHNLEKSFDDLNESDFDDWVEIEMPHKDEIAEKENILTSSVNGQNKDSKLDLTSFKRCIILDILKEKFDLILKLQEHKGTRIATCRLQGPWLSLKININDIVSITAEWDEKLQNYIVSGKSGLLVTHPDCLISGTSVVGSLFCQRKGVLSDYFKGIDSENKIMTIGSIIHELLQLILRNRVFDFEEIKKSGMELLNSSQINYMLYASKMSIEEAQNEIKKFVPKINQFVKRYVLGDVSGVLQTDKDIFKGTIDTIQDIEENIWIPQLGLKGKVDVSVRVRKKTRNFTEQLKYMPLELKTGKASFSSEHKGQIILYQMMMSELGNKVDSGLLLYLREGIMREIPATRNEQRDLILLRNELSHYISRKTKVTIEKENLTYLQLPDPINHHSACSNCPYNTICSTLLSRDKTILLSENNPLKKVSEKVISHLLPSHIDYFIQWCSLLLLEDEECRKHNHMKRLWTESPEARKKYGHTLTNLKISGNVLAEADHFIHVFVDKNYADGNATHVLRDTSDLTISGIGLSDYLIVSTSKRIAIAAGRVQLLGRNMITLLLERNLSDNYKNEIFHLDKYESQTLLSFNLTNVGTLLDNNPVINRLREIIVNKISPTFINVLPKSVAQSGKNILLKLNQIQRRAVMKALTANEYLLIKGLPGTGKTQTLVSLIQLFVLIGKSVLITSHTHSAIDNVLLRLMKAQIKFIRLGSTARIRPELQKYSEINLIANCKTPTDLSTIYNSYNVVGVTCLGAAHPLLVQRMFDVCVVDEATQVLQAAVIRPLLSAQKFILFGDPEQLPPIIRSKEARSLGADETLFSRLDSPEATFTLSMQYRMNKTITKLANDLTYKGELKCANDSIGNATITLPHKEKLNEFIEAERWLSKPLSGHIDMSVIFLDTGNVYDKNVDFAEAQRNDPSIFMERVFGENREYEENQKEIKTRTYTNYCEAGVILRLLITLIESGFDGNEIGIIAPYRAQVELLKQIIELFQKKCNLVGLLGTNFMGIEVNTVDQYQGRDKEIIIYSCTKSDYPATLGCPSVPKDIEILEDKRRLTVAITRSKHKLIIIGDIVSLDKYTPFQELLKFLKGPRRIQLVDDKFDFNWKSALDQLESILQSNEDSIINSQTQFD